MYNIIRLNKKQEKAQKILNNPAIKEKLCEKSGSLNKLIEENDDFVLSMCELYDTEQDFDELADTLLRYLQKHGVIYILLSRDKLYFIEKTIFS